jgi:hypothetical protein
MIKAAAFCFLLLSSGPVIACSTTLNVPIFQPSGKGADELDFVHLPRIPALKARVLKVVRASPHYMCDYSATFTVEVSWDEPSTLPISEFGLYFRPTPPTATWVSFGNVPIQGAPVWLRNAVVVTIYVSDNPIEHHDAIDIPVQLFAIDQVAQLGPPSSFVLHADADY